MNYILDKNSKEYELMGGKATALSKIGMLIDNIPDWFVFTYTGFDIKNKDLKNEAKEELSEKIEKLPDDTYFAVRSSAGNEDSADNSFAGQFDTFLYVKKEEIIDKVKEVCMSAFSERIETYRKENNIKDILVPSVIIQKMVNSETSGVAFGANPINSNVKEIVISAVYGLGSGLVDGIATADTYTITNDKTKKKIAKKDYCHKLINGKVEQKEVEKNKRNKQVITNKQIEEVKQLVIKASKYFDRYQDIEWAFEDDRLYLLQSRPITTLGISKDENAKINVFDNSNIVESYGGITTPLTFSFIRTVYENVYIQLCKIFKIKQEKIEMNSQMFKNMLALIDGRVYYNLYGWYGILTMFPGLGSNKKFMESMMGVKESLPDNLFPVPKSNFRDKISLISAGAGLLGGFFKLRGMTNKFYNRLGDALEERDIDNMDLYELHDYYYELERKLLHKWDAPLVNDFLAMIFYGQLKTMCNKIFKNDGDKIHNDLLCNEGNIISAEPARRIKQMAKIAKDDESLLNLLENDDVLYIQKELPKYKKFNDELNNYLDKFSDRCLEELKLETLTLRENPSSLYHSISTFAKRMKENNIKEIDSEKVRKDAEEKVHQALKLRPLEKAKFNFILKQARYTVKNRENLRFERTRLFGRVREIFLRIGFILKSMNIIEEKRDIFYLEVNEILFYIDGKSTTNNLKELIEIRKNQYEKYKEMLPDERFYSYGAVNIGNDFKHENKQTKEQDSKSDLKGIGASPGRVKGKVRVIKNPANAKLEQGEILVAEFTDPGWIMLFPAASGILVERGSLLSHSAIVSRELGIPAVVGITGLIDNIKTGDEVEMDGTTGQVRILSQDKSKTESENCFWGHLPKTSKKTIRNLIENLSVYGDKNIYENITYNNFIEMIKSLSYEISKHENKKIAIMSENRFEWEVTFLAIMCAGSIAIPLDKSLSKMEIENIIKRTNIEKVFCSSETESILNEIDGIDTITFDSDEYKKMLNNKETFNGEIDENQTATIIYTSGTTSKSKAVELSHKNLVLNILNSSKILNLNENGTTLSIMPLNHVLEGLLSLLISLLSGSKRIYCYGVENIIDTINKNNVTFMCGTPAVFKYLLERLDELKVKPLFLSAGAPLDKAVQEKYFEKGFKLIQAYGMTESGPTVSIENDKEYKIGSVGKILDNVECKIINQDENGNGEILIKTDNLFLGYYQDKNNYLEDGWFNTGDIGKIDDDGYLYITGRKKNLIVLQNGKKVFPEELEELINNIENVKESFVYSKESQNKTVICATISCEEKDIENIKNKIEELNNNISSYKRIQEVNCINEPIQRTSSLKVIRKSNVEKAKNNCDKVKEIIAKQLDMDLTEIKEYDNLRDKLGADSLDKAEIIFKIQSEFCIEIPREEYKNINTVKDLIERIH